MKHGKFQVGHAYYRIGFTIELENPVPQGTAIKTWFYQGYFQLSTNAPDCDVPYYFYVFQPFAARGNPMGEPAENGLRFASLREAERLMLNFDELLSALAVMEG